MSSCGYVIFEQAWAGKRNSYKYNNRREGIVIVRIPCLPCIFNKASLLDEVKVQERGWIPTVIQTLLQ